MVILQITINGCNHLNYKKSIHFTIKEYTKQYSILLDLRIQYDSNTIKLKELNDFYPVYCFSDDSRALVAGIRNKRKSRKWKNKKFEYFIITFIQTS